MKGKKVATVKDEKEEQTVASPIDPTGTNSPHMDALDGKSTVDSKTGELLWQPEHVRRRCNDSSPSCSFVAFRGI